jgi:hypothetical protein
VNHLSGCDEIGLHLDGFFEQHIARWAGTLTPSIFLENASRAFYRNLLGSMCANGWITFTVLESEGRPIAYHFGFTYSNVFVLYKPVYDPLLARRSPGQVLLKELMDFAVAQGCDEFDFTVGAEAYKQRFATETRYNTTYAIVKCKGQLRALQLRTGIKRLLEGNPLGARLLGLRKRLVSRMIPRLKETLHRYGFAGWTLRAAGILFQRFIYRYNKILFLEMAGGLAPERVIEPRIKGVVFHEGTLEDLVRFEYPESPVLKQDFLAAWKKDLAKGDKCFVAEIEGEVAATVWIRFQDYAYISEADTHITFEDKPLYIYDAWTLPEFRGKNLLPFLYSKMLALYPDRRKIVYFHESNVGSLRAALKLGSFRVTRIYYLLSILGIKWRWSKPYTGPQPEL